MVNCRKNPWAVHVCCVPDAPHMPSSVAGMGHVLMNVPRAMSRSHIDNATMN